MKVYFFHVMKTGGRSIINSFLASLMGYEDDVIDDDRLDGIWNMYIKSCKGILDFDGFKFFGHYVLISHRFDPFNHQEFFYVSHDENFKVKKVACGDDSIHTITCLRNPLERFLSRYKEALFSKKNRGVKEHTSIHSDLVESLGNNILDFANNVGSVKHEQLRFFSQSLDVEGALKNLRNIDTILFNESLYRDLKLLANKLDINLPYVHVGRTTNDGFDYSTIVKEHELVEITKLLEKDFEFYNRARIIKLIEGK